MYFLRKQLSQQIGFKSVSPIDWALVVYTKEYEYVVIHEELFSNKSIPNSNVSFLMTSLIPVLGSYGYNKPFALFDYWDRKEIVLNFSPTWFS